MKFLDSIKSTAVNYALRNRFVVIIFTSLLLGGSLNHRTNSDQFVLAQISIPLFVLFAFCFLALCQIREEKSWDFGNKKIKIRFPFSLKGGQQNDSL